MSATTASSSQQERSVSLFLVLAGPSGVGKATLTKALLERHPEIHRLYTVTTRPPRPGEVPGDQYIFVDRETFIRMVETGELMESTPVYKDGNLYGMPANILNQVPPDKDIALIEVDIKGKEFLKQRYPDCVTVLIVAPIAELRDRLLQRDPNIDPEEYRKRMASALNWLKAAPTFDYIVENPTGEMEKAISVLEAILVAELHRPHRYLPRHPLLADIDLTDVEGR